MDFVNFNENHLLVKKLKPAYYQLGFMCSVQALPELLDLEQWLVYLWNDEISFDDEQQATEYAQIILNMTSEINALYENMAPLSALNCDTWISNGNQQVNKNGSDFAAGFLSAIELFNAQWSLVEDDEATQNMLQTTILLLTKLLPKEEIEAQFLEIIDQLPKVAEILQILPQLMSNLAYSVAQPNI